LIVDNVDTTSFPDVSIAVSVIGPGTSDLTFPPPDFEILENGSLVSDLTTASLSSRPQSTIFLIDTSTSMAESGKLDLVRTALTSFARQSPPPTDDVIAVVTFDNVARQVMPFRSPADLAGLRLSSAGDRSNLAAGLGVAIDASMPRPSPRFAGPWNIVVVTDGHDRLSSVELASAQSDAAALGVRIITVAIEGQEIDNSALDRLVRVTGGWTLRGKPSALSEMFSNLRDSLALQFQVHYESAATRDPFIDLEIRAWEQRIRVSNVAKGIQTRSLDSEDVSVVHKGALRRLIDGDAATWTIALLVFIAASLLILTSANRFLR
jgi:uncharacterized protein YegL